MKTALQCSGQCHGCAFKSGADANSEAHNNLRGIFAALGGYSFACHESLGWRDGRPGYPDGVINALAILSMNRQTLINVGVDESALEKQVAAVRKDLRMCGGWKLAVARLHTLGWFEHPDVRLVRRHFAKSAAAALERLNESRAYERTGTELKEIEDAIEWFFDEAKADGIKIGWLFGSTAESSLDNSARLGHHQ